MPRDSVGLPVLVFDLDGTILECNSFPAWVLHHMCGRISGMPLRRRIFMSRSSLSLVVRRKLARIDHDRLMRGLQTAWAGVDAEASARFEAAMLRRVRASFRPALDVVAAGADAVLATAAAGEYADALGRRLGFRHVLSTPAGRGWGEGMNTGARKRDRVLALIEEREWDGRPIVFFNDHMDDLPLMERSDVVCWLGGEKDFQSARKALPNVRFFDCSAYDAAAMKGLLERLGFLEAEARLSSPAS